MTNVIVWPLMIALFVSMDFFYIKINVFSHAHIICMEIFITEIVKNVMQHAMNVIKRQTKTAYNVETCQMLDIYIRDNAY